MRYPTNNEIIIAYKKTRFHKGNTAKDLQISRSLLYTLINTREELAKMIFDAEEERLDNAEEALEKLVESDNFQAVKFTLETKGKKRGYGNSLELTGNSTKPLSIITSKMTQEEAARAYLDTISPEANDL